MSLVSTTGLTAEAGGRTLFSGAGFSVGAQDRCGLIGANGTGKSTLLRILSGEREPDDGKVQYRKGARVGHLPQEIAEVQGGSLIEWVLSSVPGRGALEIERDALERAIQQATDEATQLEQAQALAETAEELEHFEERFGRHQAERILQGLGFKETDMPRDVAAFSGGWRMRAALGALLLQDPDLLLLDEPTNHLDVPTLHWFDAFLRRYRKAFVLITHDAGFLERQARRILSIEPEGLVSYEGRYSEYRVFRVGERERLERVAEKHAARRAELMGFVERFGAKATKATQAQSRLKMVARLDAQGVTQLQDREAISLSFPEAGRPARDVLAFEGISFGFDPATPLYRDVGLALERGKRVAVIGANGTGKTTLLRLAAGELTPTAGEVRFGANVEAGYYAQHHAEILDPTRTVLESLAEVDPAAPERRLRTVLGAFLFQGDDVHKKVGVLSGGERARVALSRLAARPTNLLMMDEPTNHLDLDSAEQLAEALAEYGGALLFVSHDRGFVDKLATEIWEVRDGGVLRHPGNLSEYLEHLESLGETLAGSAPGRGGGSAGKEGASAAAPSAGKNLGAGAPAGSAPGGSSGKASGASPNGAGGDAGQAGGAKGKERRRQEAEERARRNAVEGPLKKEVASLEAQIAELEQKVEAEEAALADPALYDDFEKARPRMEAHQQAKDALEALYTRWSEATDALEAARAGMN